MRLAVSASTRRGERGRVVFVLVVVVVVVVCWNTVCDPQVRNIAPQKKSVVWFRLLGSFCAE